MDDQLTIIILQIATFIMVKTQNQFLFLKLEQSIFIKLFETTTP